MSSSSSLKRRLLIGGAVAVLLLLGAGALFAASTWGDVNRVSIDRPDTETPSGGAVAHDDEESDDSDSGQEQEQIDTGLKTFLLVGSDSRIDLEDTEGFGDFEGNRSDVVMVLFKDGSKTGILSLPRDLMVEDPCRDRENRLSELLEGCPNMNGPTLLTVAVENLIGQSIDHFALVDLAGFQAAVDAVGGYEICVDRPVRDRLASLELPEGCTLADGEQTLAWLRSRRTQELTADGWRTMPGVNDLVRNERQREFLIDMMRQVSDVTSPQDVVQAARAVAPYVTVDADLTLMDAANIANSMRGIGSGAVTEIEIPVIDDTTSGGAAVLRASEPVDEIVAEFLSTTASDKGTVLGLAG